MAKLGAYYGLCPLIDHKSLLGVSENEENGVVIVTLGKNIAIKHKLSDQKQLHSWRTKEKFTSPVIYDPEQSKYVAVFNQTYLKQWTKEDESLDKLKKLKFIYQIQTVFCCGGKSFILFKCGTILPLREAIELRKTLSLVPIVKEDSETITDVLYIAQGGDVYVGLLIKNSKEYYLLWTVYDSKCKAEKYFKILIEREASELVGYVFHKQGKLIYFLSLWSDGKMFSNILQPEDTSTKTSGIVFTVIESLTCKEPVSMASLDEDYIALYGADCNQEGATLIIYNVQFKVTQSRQPLKLFTKGARLWCIENNIILPIGQNLAVIPYHLDTEQLAALVGSHRLIENELDSDVSIVQDLVIGDWGIKEEDEEIDLPKQLKLKISELFKQGYPENSIIEQLLPDIIEKHDVVLISHVLKTFSDISEKFLVQFIKIILNTRPELFKLIFKSNIEKLPQNLKPNARIHLLDITLSKRFSDVIILPYIRSTLNLDDVLKLIEYLCFMLSEDGHCLPGLDVFETESKIIEWSCTLLDSNFQKFLLSHDESVDCILKKFKDTVDSQLSSFNDLRKFSMLLNECSKGKNVNKSQCNSSFMYSMELINLY